MLFFKKEKKQVAPVEKKKKNSALKIIADKHGVSYEEVRDKAKAVREEYNIPYYTFAKKDLFVADTETIQKYVATRDSFVKKSQNKIAEKTGKSLEEAIAMADEDVARLGISFRKYYFNRLYLLSKEEQNEKVKQWDDNKNFIIKAAMDETQWSEDAVKKHMRKCDILWGIDADHYYAFRAWRHDDDKLSTYVTHPLSKAIRNKYSNDETMYLTNKVLFDEKFADYIKRKYWVNRDTNFEEFEEFLDGLDEIFAKPTDSSMSRGAMKIKITPETNHKELYDSLMVNEEFIVEECVKQHPAISALNDSCVNTVRAITILKDDKFHLVFALLKIGDGGIADNLVRGGVAAAIDTKTGVIIADGVNAKGDVFEKHPTSGVKLKGYQIPNWDSLLDTLDKAMRVLPGVNYVGWDVAITEDGVKLIEGNSTPDIGLCQITMANEEVGLKPYFDPFI